MPTVTAKVEPLSSFLPVDKAPESVIMADVEGNLQPLPCLICDLVWP